MFVLVFSACVDGLASLHVDSLTPCDLLPMTSYLGMGSETRLCLFSWIILVLPCRVVPPRCASHSGVMSKSFDVQQGKVAASKQQKSKESSVHTCNHTTLCSHAYIVYGAHALLPTYLPTYRRTTTLHLGKAGQGSMNVRGTCTRVQEI